jgi:hypothetical protein
MATIQLKNHRSEMPWRWDKYIDVKKVRVENGAFCTVCSENCHKF